MICLFTHFWLWWVLAAVLAVLGLVAVGGGFSSCGVRASHCGGLSCCRARGLQRRPSGCGAQARLPRGTWDLPGPGSHPCLLHWEADSLTTEPQGSPGGDVCFFNLLKFFLIFGHTVLLAGSQFPERELKSL